MFQHHLWRFPCLADGHYGCETEICAKFLLKEGRLGLVTSFARHHLQTWYCADAEEEADRPHRTTGASLGMS